jgi:hypothetical protein
MGKQQRQYNEQFKFKVALEAAKGLRTTHIGIGPGSRIVPATIVD